MSFIHPVSAFGKVVLFLLIVSWGSEKEKFVLQLFDFVFSPDIPDCLHYPKEPFNPNYRIKYVKKYVSEKSM